MERKMWEIFNINDEWYQTVKSDGECCKGCAFYKEGCHAKYADIGSCGTSREDRIQVIFKKLETVWKPITVKERTFQKLILDNCSCADCVFNIQNKECYKNNYIDGPCPDNEIWVEIKQTKEDMGKKKQSSDIKFRTIARAKEHLFQATNIAENKKELEVLDSFLLRCWQMGWLKQYEDVEESKSNLKPFDIEAAKANKPVCTRSGKQVRIVCFDKVGAYPVIALVQEEGIETCHFYSQDGKCANCGSEYDLMMLCEKKKGYVNVYSNIIHATIEDADKVRKRINNSNYMYTLEVEWEE